MLEIIDSVKTTCSDANYPHIHAIRNDGTEQCTIRHGSAKTSAREESTVFKCQECGYRYQTIDEEEIAVFDDAGCPGCGSQDVDICVGE